MKWGFTAADVKRMREETGQGMQDCRARLEKAEMLRKVAKLRKSHNPAICDILDWLVERA